MPPGPSLFSRLRHRDRAVREAAQRRVAERVAAHGGDVRAAAAELGISVSTARRWTERPGPAAGSEPGAFPGPGSADRTSEAARPEPPAAAAAPPPQTPREGPPRRRAQPSPFADFAAHFRRPLGDQAPPAAQREPDSAPTATTPGPTAFGAPRPPHAPMAAESSRPAPPAPATPQRHEVNGAGTNADASANLRPHHPRETAPPAPVPPASEGAPRRLAFVLHAHLPWVLGHGTWPHGEDWLAEAVVHCYLPLVGALRRLAAAGGRHLLALSVSPVLAAQLADPRLRPLVDGYLAHRTAAAGALGAEHPLGGWWHGVFTGLAVEWEALGGDLLAALRALQSVEAIELSTCAATHGYLPLLHRPEHVALQVQAARHNHERWFGAAPAGLWMPECAYRPPGPWHHPVTGAREAFRPGNEGFLVAAGLRWTVVDAHLLLGDEPLLPYPFGAEAPDAAGEDAGGRGEPAATPVAARLQPHQIDAAPLAALFREPHTARQVWSRQGGYPGDQRYLDFHKRDGRSGLRLWRVTDAGGDLGDKLAYHPADAADAAREHARHFVDMLAAVPGLGGGVAVSPYDAELFGHWWFEGPLWLEETLARCLADPRVTPTTPRRELASSPPRRRAELREGSWGEAGDHRVWANEGTAWMWRELREAEEGVAAALAAGLDGPRARAALAQLMLLAASDWPFLVTTGTAADYAAERFRTHRARLADLLAPPSAGAPLPEWAEQDLAGLDIDPRWWHWEAPG